MAHMNKQQAIVTWYTCCITLLFAAMVWQVPYNVIYGMAPTLQMTFEKWLLSNLNFEQWLLIKSEDHNGG